MPTDLDRFAAACVYPGKLDEQAVERELAAFLRALGLRQRIVRLRTGWRLQDDRPPNRDIEQILLECDIRERNINLDRSFRRNMSDILGHVRVAWRLRVTVDRNGNGHAALAFDDRALTARRAGDAGDADAALAVLGSVVFNGVAAREAPGARSGCGIVAAALVGAFLFESFVGSTFASSGLGLFIVSLVAFTVGTMAQVGVRASLVFAALVPAALMADPASALIGLPALIILALVVGGIAERAFVVFAADPEAHATRIHRAGSMWELSWSVCALFGAVERRKPAVEAWLRPLFEAFVCGCWLIYWTDDTLYWVAKPAVHREPDTRRFHHDTRAALESDIVNLYFWQGVMVPPFVILKPDSIRIRHIDRETNAEVRRVMIERYRHGEEIHGAATFIRDGRGVRLDHHERYGTLWRRNIRNDEPIVMIEVVNRTREPDGRFKRYWLRVPPTMRTAREALAWTFDMPAQRYAPETET
jgi:hypothetical protein